MTTWIAVFAVGAGSYAFRVLPLFSGWLAVPPLPVERALQHAGTASLTALLAMAVRHQTVHTDRAGAAATLSAVLAGVVAARLRAPMYAVVAVGIAVHLVTRAMLSSL